MSKPQNVMLVSIALTAATVCTARACTKRLDETQWPETRDETYWAETETYCFETEKRPRRDASACIPVPICNHFHARQANSG